MRWLIVLLLLSACAPTEPVVELEPLPQEPAPVVEEEVKLDPQPINEQVPQKSDTLTTAPKHNPSAESLTYRGRLDRLGPDMLVLREDNSYLIDEEFLRLMRVHSNKTVTLMVDDLLVHKEQGQNISWLDTTYLVEQVAYLAPLTTSGDQVEFILNDSEQALYMDLYEGERRKVALGSHQYDVELASVTKKRMHIPAEATFEIDGIRTRALVPNITDAYDPFSNTTVTVLRIFPQPFGSYVRESFVVIRALK